MIHAEKKISKDKDILCQNNTCKLKTSAGCMYFMIKS